MEAPGKLLVPRLAIPACGRPFIVANFNETIDGLCSDVLVKRWSWSPVTSMLRALLLVRELGEKFRIRSTCSVVAGRAVGCCKRRSRSQISLHSMPSVGAGDRGSAAPGRGADAGRQDG